MLKIIPTVVSSGRGQCLPDDAIAMFDMHDKEPDRCQKCSDRSSCEVCGGWNFEGEVLTNQALCET